MNWTPHPYQIAAMEFALKRDGCGLMLDPGLGKTSITLAVIDIARAAGDVRKVLVVAPLRVCNTVWPVEARKWNDFHGLRVKNLCNHATKDRAALLKDPTWDVYLINPQSFVKLVSGGLPHDFDMLVVDESTKYKDTQTLGFKAMRGVLPQFKRRMILTGTPIPNGVQDLFGQMFIVDSGASLGKYVTHFRMEFCHQSPTGFGWDLNRGADEMIYARVKNRLMRMDAKDHLAMPEYIDNFIEVDLPTRLRSQYHELEKAFVAELAGNKIAVFNPSAVGTKLRQMANGFVYDDGNGAYERVAVRLHTEKVDALEELVEEMQGRPLLVAYEFIEDADMIRERLPQAIDLGKVKDVQRTVDQFNKGAIPLLIAHPASAGHGLNLQEACNTVCCYGITWNLEWYQQFIARVYRQGQKAPSVVVHHIVCKGTKDEDVMGALRGKDKTQRSFNDAVKGARRPAGV